MRRLRLFTCWFLYLWLVTPSVGAVDLTIDPLSIQDRLTRVVTPQAVNLDAIIVYETLTKAELGQYLQRQFLLDGNNGERHDGTLVDWGQEQESVQKLFGKNVSPQWLADQYQTWYQSHHAYTQKLSAGNVSDLENLLETNFNLETDQLQSQPSNLFDSLRSKLITTWSSTDWEEFALKKGLPGVGILLMGLFSLWRKRKEDEKTLAGYSDFEKDTLSEKYSDKKNYKKFYWDTTKVVEEKEHAESTTLLQRKNVHPPTKPRIIDIATRSIPGFPSKRTINNWKIASPQSLLLSFERKFKTPESQKIAFDQLKQQMTEVLGLYKQDKYYFSSEGSPLRDKLGSFIELFYKKHANLFVPDHFKRIPPNNRQAVIDKYIKTRISQWKRDAARYHIPQNGAIRTAHTTYLNALKRHVTQEELYQKRKISLLAPIRTKYTQLRQKITQYWHLVTNKKQSDVLFKSKSQLFGKTLQQAFTSQKSQDRADLDLFQEAFTGELSTTEQTQFLQSGILPAFFHNKINTLFPDTSKAQIIKNRFSQMYQSIAGVAEQGVEYFEKQLTGIQESSLYQKTILQLEKQLQSPTSWDKDIQAIRKQQQKPYLISWETKEASIRARNPHISPNSLAWVKNDWQRKQKHIGVGINGESLAQHNLSEYVASIARNRTPYSPTIEKTLRRLVQTVYKEKQAGGGGYQNWQEYFYVHPLRKSALDKQRNEQVDILRAAKEKYHQALQEKISTLRTKQKKVREAFINSAQWLRQSQQERTQNPLTQTILAAQDNQTPSTDASGIDLITSLQTELGEETFRLGKEAQRHKNVPFVDPFEVDPETMVQNVLKDTHYFASERGQKTTNYEHEEAFKEKYQDYILAGYSHHQIAELIKKQGLSDRKITIDGVTLPLLPRDREQLPRLNEVRKEYGRSSSEYYVAVQLHQRFNELRGTTYGMPNVDLSMIEMAPVYREPEKPKKSPSNTKNNDESRSSVSQARTAEEIRKAILTLDLAPDPLSLEEAKVQVPHYDAAAEKAFVKWEKKQRKKDRKKHPQRFLWKDDLYRRLFIQTEDWAILQRKKQTTVLSGPNAPTRSRWRDENWVKNIVFLVQDGQADALNFIKSTKKEKSVLVEAARKERGWVKWGAKDSRLQDFIDILSGEKEYQFSENQLGLIDIIKRNIKDGNDPLTVQTASSDPSEEISLLRELTSFGWDNKGLIASWVLEQHRVEREGEIISEETLTPEDWDTVLNPDYWQEKSPFVNRWKDPVWLDEMVGFIGEGKVTFASFVNSPDEEKLDLLFAVKKRKLELKGGPREANLEVWDKEMTSYFFQKDNNILKENFLENAQKTKDFFLESVHKALLNVIGPTLYNTFLLPFITHVTLTKDLTEKLLKIAEYVSQFNVALLDPTLTNEEQKQLLDRVHDEFLGSIKDFGVAVSESPEAMKNVDGALRRWHVDERLAKNINLPIYEEQVDNDEWKELSFNKSLLHQNEDGVPDLKFVHEDGREVVYDGKTKEIIRDPKIFGTYNYGTLLEAKNYDNYVDYIKAFMKHTFFDFLPYYTFGGNI